MLRATGQRPRIAVLLASGLGAARAARGGRRCACPTSLPGFPQTGIAGHAGELLFGRIGAHEVAVLAAVHAYEGGDVAGDEGRHRRAGCGLACRPWCE